MSDTKDQGLTSMVAGRPSSSNEDKGMLRSSFPKQFTIEIEMSEWIQKVIVGEKGNRLKSIEQSTGTRIDIPASDNPRKSVRISGTRESVTKATKEIKHISDTAQANYRKDEDTKATKEIKHISDTAQANYRKDGDTKATKEIKHILDTAQANYRKDGDKPRKVDDADRATTVLECVIPRKYRGKVIGTKGVHVKTLSHEHSVSINFPQRTTNSEADKELSTGNGDPNDVILITGKEENCLRAKEALLNLVPSEIALEVPSRFHRAIIGPRGENVRSMGDQYGVWIHVPKVNPASEKDCLYVQGPPSNCEIAKEALLNLVKKLEGKAGGRELRRHRETVQVAPKYHPRIIGRRGATINKIRKKYDVAIELPDKANATQEDIYIIGYEHQARAAKEEILQIVEDLEERTSEVVDIDFRVHARLIGTRGSAISRVTKRFNVKVDFPEDNWSNKVTITGKEQNVKDAKQHLQLLASDLMGHSLERDADQKFYKQSTLASRDASRDLHDCSGRRVRNAPWTLADFPCTRSQKPPKRGTVE